MAYMPCDCHGQPFRGRSSYSYPAVIHDQVVLRKRVRLCRAGVDELRAFLGKYLDNQNGDGSLPEADRRTCFMCRQEVTPDEGELFFLTTYLDKDARADWGGLFHVRHEPDVLRIASLAG